MAAPDPATEHGKAADAEDADEFEVTMELYMRASDAERTSGSNPYFALLAERYYRGIGVKRNLQEALAWAKKAAETGRAEGQALYGEVLMELGMLEEEALVNFWMASRQGNVRAKTNIGKCYIKGFGVDFDPTKACKYFTWACEYDDPEAQYQLASCLMLGVGVDRDAAQAAALLKKAASQDHPGAALTLGMCLKVGAGGPPSEEESTSWLRAATRLGHCVGAAVCTMVGIGGRPDIRKDPQDDYEAAGESVDVLAHFLVGMYYYQSASISPMHLEYCRRVWNTAARHHAPIARFALGLLHLYEILRPRKCALSLLWQAAREGARPAAKLLSECGVTEHQMPCESLRYLVSWSKRVGLKESMSALL